MAKQKKKSTPLSSLTKAFATAGNFPSLQPVEFRKDLEGFKKRTRERIQTIGIEKDVTKPPVWTEANKDLRQLLQGTDDETAFFIYVRSIILYTWYQKKVVYTFDRDTVDFILNKFPANILRCELDPLLFYMCKAPIYLEFPDDSLVTGVFCGLTSLMSKPMIDQSADPNRAETSHFSIALIRNGDVQCLVHRSYGQTVEEYVDKKDADTIERLVFLSLCYVFFLQTREDAEGVVLLKKRRQDAECWDVRPIPFPEALPNPGDIHGSISAGLSFYLRFLSRSAMIEQYQNAAKALIDYQEIDLEEVSPSDKACNRKYAEMVLDWEAYRVVFQYDAKTEDSLHEKYWETLANEGIRENLVRYLPQRTVVLYQKDSGIVTLMSTCSVRGSTKPGLFWMCIEDGGSAIGAIPVGSKPTGKAFMDIFMAPNAAQAAFCALLHILLVYESKAIKKMTKDTLTAGDPSTTVLAPYQQKGKATQTVDGPVQKTAPEYRVSSDLEYTPFELFDLTNRTVKRVRQTERLARAGWKMPPHTRRPHPHRYWVGSGANKHMEVRWLERMQIHKDQPIETTTIHNVK